MKNLGLRKKVCLSIFGIIGISSVSAQDVSVDVGADVVSSYVWRGFSASGASVQPSLSLAAGDFSLGAWGSTDISTFGYKEVDFTASYVVKGVKLAVTDYWWGDVDGDSYNYFGKTRGHASHSFEGTLAYTLPESFPLTLSWNTFFAGKYDLGSDDKATYSTYIEAAYPFKVGGVDMSASVGVIPWTSAVYGTDGFEFASIQIGASKEIKITDSYSLPVFGSVIASPAADDIHFVFGIKLF